MSVWETIHLCISFRDFGKELLDKCSEFITEARLYEELDELEQTENENYLLLTQLDHIGQDTDQITKVVNALRDIKSIIIKHSLMTEEWTNEDILKLPYLFFFSKTCIPTKVMNEMEQEHTGHDIEYKLKFLDPREYSLQDISVDTVIGKELVIGEEIILTKVFSVSIYHPYPTYYTINYETKPIYKNDDHFQTHVLMNDQENKTITRPYRFVAVENSIDLGCIYMHISSNGNEFVRRPEKVVQWWSNYEQYYYDYDIDFHDSMHEIKGSRRKIIIFN